MGKHGDRVRLQVLRTIEKWEEEQPYGPLYGLYLADVCDRTGLSKQNLLYHLNVLRDRGLVTWERHKRGTLCITEKGEQVVEQCR